MTDFGHVKISRRMFAEDPFWTEPRAFSRAEAWIDLVQRAAWRPYRQVAKGVVVELDRGEALASLRFLASAWGWGIKKVRVFLALLVEMDRIRAQREAQSGTVYLIVNYEHYQSGGPREDTDEGTVGAQSGHSEGTVRAQREGSKAGKAGKAVKAVEGQVDIQPLHAMDQIDPDLLINGVIRAANAGMIDNPALDQSAVRPIPVGHGASRQAVSEWLAKGIPWEAITETVYYTAAEYKPTDEYRQIRSLAYFDNPVRDRHEADAARAFPRPQRTPGVSVHPDAEVHQVRSEAPGARRVAESQTGTQPFRLSRIIEEMQQQGFRVPAAKKLAGAKE